MVAARAKTENVSSEHRFTFSLSEERTETNRKVSNFRTLTVTPLTNFASGHVVMVIIRE